MNNLYWFLGLLITIVGCASSSNNNPTPQSLENLVSLQKPIEQSSQTSKVYIDSVKQITSNQEQALLIHGTFPDGCTNLEEITHSVKNDSLYLELKAWRDTEMMCAQVLTPFSYIYEKLNQEEISSYSEVIINDTAYSF